MNNYFNDERVQELVKTMFEEKTSLSEHVFVTLNEMLNIAEDNNDERLMGFAHYHLADSLYALEIDYGRFRSHLGKAINYLQRSNDEELLARAYNYVAIEALNNGIFDVAYYYFMNALRTCENVENDYLKSVINNNIGQIYARLRNPERAIEYVKLSSILQERCSKDDIYFNQNMIVGYFSEGVLNIEMGKLDEAKKCDEKIREFENKPDYEGAPSIALPIASLRLQIAILDDNKEDIEKWSNEFIVALAENHRLFDFATDIKDLCLFLIKHDYLDLTKKIIDDISKPIESSTVILMQRELSSIKIAYFEKAGDKSEMVKNLQNHYALILEQETEQNRIYQYSIDLINSTEELRIEQNRVREENIALQHQAQTDSLTSIPNILLMDKTLDDTFNESLKDDAYFGIDILDINRFKQYNDTYGHQEGDKCLRKVAQKLYEIAKEEKLYCARYGGDEFIIIFDNRNDDEIKKFIKKLDDAIWDLNIEHKNGGVHKRVYFSHGICNDKAKKAKKPYDFLSVADNALYATKREIKDDKKNQRIIISDLSMKYN